MKGAVAELESGGAVYTCPHCGKVERTIVDDDIEATRAWLSKPSISVCHPALGGCGGAYELVGAWVLHHPNASGDSGKKN